MTFSFRPAKRSEAKPRKRYDCKCDQCGSAFTSRRRDCRYCSQGCVWRATKTPEFNARIARETAQQRGDARRGTGTRGYVKRDGKHEHRKVAEQKLGRPLLPGEVVHHIDEDKHNNDPSNLAVMTQGEHMREHGLATPGIPIPWQPEKYRWPK